MLSRQRGVILVLQEGMNSVPRHCSFSAGVDEIPESKGMRGAAAFLLDVLPLRQDRTVLGGTVHGKGKGGTS